MSERTVFQSMSHKHVVSLGPKANVWEAACVMTRANCGSVLIVDTTGLLLGIVTERDLMTRVLAKALVPAATLVSDAVLIMIERGFRHLPIMAISATTGSKILGVFSVRDALPREVGAAVSMAEFNEQINDARG